MFFIPREIIRKHQKTYPFFMVSGRVEKPADWVTFTKEIINGKFHFLCSVCCFLINDFEEISTED